MRTDISSVATAFEKLAFPSIGISGMDMLKRCTKTALGTVSASKGFSAAQQLPLRVLDEDGTILSAFSADLFVEQSLIVELKACRALADEHIAQLLGYLRASRIEHGLLINFGSPRLEVRRRAPSDS